MTIEDCLFLLKKGETDKNSKKTLKEMIRKKKKEEKEQQRQQELQSVAQRTTKQRERSQEIKNKAREKLSSGDFNQLEEIEIKSLAHGIILTTETCPVDMPIKKRLEIITAECVYGINLFRDFFMNVRDIFGGRSKASQKVLRDARKTCLFELKREALMVGANAVVGVRLDYNEISGGGKSSLLFLVASGTAVKLEE